MESQALELKGLAKNRCPHPKGQLDGGSGLITQLLSIVPKWLQTARTPHIRHQEVRGCEQALGWDSRVPNLHPRLEGLEDDVPNCQLDLVAC